MVVKLPAVILAGGRSSRMGGGDKGLVPFGAGRLLDAVIARLSPQVGPLALNAVGDAGRFAGYGLPVLADPVAGQPGPLAGILAAMDWAATTGAPRVLTVPCDAPFLPADLVARLAATDPTRPAIAATAAGLHPVVALWPVTCAALIRAALARGERRVRAVTTEATAVTFPPGPPDPFLNLNTPDDLRQAEGWL